MDATTTKDRLLNLLDTAVAESPRERGMREARTLLAEVRRRFGDSVATGFADCPWRPKALREMRALLDTAPTKAPTPARTAEVPPLLPPKPTPARIETAVLHRLLFPSVQANLPIDYCSLAEAEQRKALLAGAWKSHCESVLPESLAAEVTAATVGLRRRELTGSVRTVSAFTRESIKRELRKAKLTIK